MVDQPRVKERESWGYNIEFFLSLLGCAVGPGNIFRFPYICMRNGGGAFLIPYFLGLFISGIPMFVLEIYIGQSTRQSCIACWERFSPIMKGSGYTMAMLSFVYAVLYQSALAWTLYYMVAGFTWDLPWSSCGQSWNTENCVLTTGQVNVSTGDVILNATTTMAPALVANYSGLGGNGTLSNDNLGNETFSVIMNNTSIPGEPMSAAEEYWRYNVLQLSETFEEIGVPNWKLCLAHLVGVIMIFLCLCNGIRSVGKVVWITATLPYVLIIIFLIRAVLLPGSKQGMLYYITPNFDSIATPEPWILAFLQIFYTLAVGYGNIHTMASYNKLNHNFLVEAFLVPVANCLTSFLSGFVVFSCAGFLAFKSGVSVDKAMQTGPGLVFVSYPELTSHLPGGPIWSFLFFLMLLMLEIDSIFVSVEACASGITDEFNLTKRQHRYVLLFVMFLDLLAGIVLFTNAGMYIYQLIDWYYTALGLILVGTLEMLVVIWIYGFEKISNDWYMMIKRRPPKWLVVPLLGVILPIIQLTIMFWSTAKLSKPVYGNYEFPDWSEKLGWTISAILVSPVFIYPLAKLPGIVRSGNTKEGIRNLIKPNIVTSEGNDENPEDTKV